MIIASLGADMVAVVADAVAVTGGAEEAEEGSVCCFLSSKLSFDRFEGKHIHQTLDFLAFYPISFLCIYSPFIPLLCARLSAHGRTFPYAVGWLPPSPRLHAKDLPCMDHALSKTV